MVLELCLFNIYSAVKKTRFPVISLIFPGFISCTLMKMDYSAGVHVIYLTRYWKNPPPVFFYVTMDMMNPIVRNERRT